MKNKNLEEDTSRQALVVLLGDSTLQNSNYVSRASESIPGILKSQSQSQFKEKKEEKDFGNVQILLEAQDNALLENCLTQWERALSQLGENEKREKEKNMSKTSLHVVISAGGNDLLKLIQEDASTSQASAKIPLLLATYETLIKKIRQDCESLASLGEFWLEKIVVCNLYKPQSPQFRAYDPLVEDWNEKLFMLARKWGTPVEYFDYAGILTTPQDFTHVIEPSYEGGQKFSNALLAFLSRK